MDSSPSQLLFNQVSLAYPSHLPLISLPFLNVSSNANEDGDCSDPAKPRRGLFPANEQDCVNAANEMFYFTDPFRLILFARAPRAGFKLPKVFRNGTCVISIDVVNDADRDRFKPWLIAADAIIGDRRPNQKYTFSRESVATEFYYPLPASFRYRTCIVLLDMNNDGDQDTVRL